MTSTQHRGVKTRSNRLVESTAPGHEAGALAQCALSVSCTVGRWRSDRRRQLGRERHEREGG